jgi:hypothetical protein
MAQSLTLQQVIERLITDPKFEKEFAYDSFFF